LVFSDVMLALLVWEVACLVKVLLSPGSLSGAAGASIVVPITLLCVGMRAMQRLYASCYGLDEAEELKRQSYVLLATLAFAAIFALAFQVGDMVS
jgi:hypothetical protein